MTYPTLTRRPLARPAVAPRRFRLPRLNYRLIAALTLNFAVMAACTKGLLL